MDGSRGAVGITARFRVLVGASTLSGIGDGLVAAAMPLLVASQTTAPVVVAGAVAVQRLPWLLFSLHGGALADRSDLRRLLPRTDALRAAALLALTAAVAADTAIVPFAYLTALVVGIGDTLVASGLQAAVPRMVDDRDLERANTWMFVSQSATEHLTGPAVGGLLFALAMPLPFAIDAISFGLAAALMARSLPAGPVADPRDRTLTADVAEAVAWFRGHAGVRRMTMLLACFAAGQAAVLGILVLLVTEVYGSADVTFGIVLAAAAVGNLAGSAIARRVTAVLPIGRLLLLGGTIVGLAYAAMGATRSPVVAAACMALEGLVVGVVYVGALSYRQREIPAAMLGRVSAAVRLFLWGSAPVGALLAGLLATAIGVADAVVVIGSLQVLAAVGVGPRVQRSVDGPRRGGPARER